MTRCEAIITLHCPGAGTLTRQCRHRTSIQHGGRYLCGVHGRLYLTTAQPPAE